jgi:hypothetical protein
MTARRPCPTQVEPPLSDASQARQEAELICQEVLYSEMFQALLTKCLASAMAQMLPACVEAHLGKVLKRCDDIDKRVDALQARHQTVMEKLKTSFDKRLLAMQSHRGDDAKSGATTACPPSLGHTPTPSWRKRPSEEPGNPCVIEIKGWPPNSPAATITQAWKEMLSKCTATLPAPVKYATQYSHGNRINAHFASCFDAALFLENHRKYTREAPDSFTYKSAAGRAYNICATRAMSGMERFRNGRAKACESALQNSFPAKQFQVIWGRHIVLAEPNAEEPWEAARWNPATLEYDVDAAQLRQHLVPIALQTYQDTVAAHRQRMRQ